MLDIKNVFLRFCVDKMLKIAYTYISSPIHVVGGVEISLIGRWAFSFRYYSS